MVINLASATRGSLQLLNTVLDILLTEILGDIAAEALSEDLDPSIDIDDDNMAQPNVDTLKPFLKTATFPAFSSSSPTDWLESVQALLQVVQIIPSDGTDNQPVATWTNQMQLDHNYAWTQVLIKIGNCFAHADNGADFSRKALRAASWPDFLKEFDEYYRHKSVQHDARKMFWRLSYADAIRDNNNVPVPYDQFATSVFQYAKEVRPTITEKEVMQHIWTECGFNGELPTDIKNRAQFEHKLRAMWSSYLRSVGMGMSHFPFSATLNFPKQSHTAVNAFSSTVERSGFVSRSELEALEAKLTKSFDAKLQRLDDKVDAHFDVLRSEMRENTQLLRGVVASLKSSSNGNFQPRNPQVGNGNGQRQGDSWRGSYNFGNKFSGDKGQGSSSRDARSSSQVRGRSQERRSTSAEPGARGNSQPRGSGKA